MNKPQTQPDTNAKQVFRELVTINGKKYEEEVGVRWTLADFMRQPAKALGHHLGVERLVAVRAEHRREKCRLDLAEHQVRIGHDREVRAPRVHHRHRRREIPRELAFDLCVCLPRVRHDERRIDGPQRGRNNGSACRGQVGKRRSTRRRAHTRAEPARNTTPSPQRRADAAAWSLPWRPA